MYVLQISSARPHSYRAAWTMWDSIDNRKRGRKWSSSWGTELSKWMKSWKQWRERVRRPTDKESIRTHSRRCERRKIKGRWSKEYLNANQRISRTAWQRESKRPSSSHRNSSQSRCAYKLMPTSLASLASSQIRMRLYVFMRRVRVMVTLRLCLHWARSMRRGS